MDGAVRAEPRQPYTIIFRLTSFRKAIASGDDGALHAMLERGNELKERAEKTRRERKND